jgi:hypothetical protein
MKIGFAPCGFTSKEVIRKLIALGGINKNGYGLLNVPTLFYWYINSISGDIKYDDKNVLDVKLSPIDHKEVIKSLNDLPNEIKELIKQRQIDVGNDPDLKIFEKDPGINIDGGGFNWDSTKEGHNFWNALLNKKQYYKFYTLNREKTYETELQDKTTSIRRSKDIAGSGIRCERCKPAIASGHLRDRKAIKF